MDENDNSGREGQGEGSHTDHDNVFNMSISQPPQESVLGGATPSSTPRLRRRRRRAFRLTWGVARVYHITALSEFAPQQIEETWWQAGEYAQIFHENAKLLDEWMKYGRLAESTDATFRGLEQMTHEEVQRRNRLRDQAMDAVLDEQDRQYEEENLTIPNPEGVARVYALISGRASRIAHRRGLQDEEDKDTADVSPIPMVSRDRLIHFCPMVHVQTGLHRSDYTEYEAKACWFSEAEVYSFKFHSKQVIKELLKSISAHPEPDLAEAILLDNVLRDETPDSSKKPHTKICIRGLEPYLLNNKIGTRQQNVRKIWDVVLMEHDRHDSVRACVPAHLAQISRETSLPCIHVALRLAQQDESFVKKYLATEIHDYSVYSLSSHLQSEQLPRNTHCTQHQHARRDCCRDSLLMVGKVSPGLKPSSVISASIVGDQSSGPLPQAPRSPHPLAAASIKASTFDRFTKKPSKVVRRSLLAMASPLLYLDEHEGEVTGKPTKKDLEEVTDSTSPSSPGASLPSSSSSSPESESSHVFRRLKALSLGHPRQHDDDQWLRSPQRSSTVGQS
jgi:hypothetical protein